MLRDEDITVYVECEYLLEFIEDIYNFARLRFAILCLRGNITLGVLLRLSEGFSLSVMP